MKMLRNFMWMAAAAITLASCSNEEEVVNAGNKDGMKQLILIAENPDLENDSRTAIGEENGKIVPMWEAGDYISSIGNKEDTMCPMEEKLAAGTLSKTAKFVLQYGSANVPTDSLRLAYFGDDVYSYNEEMKTNTRVSNEIYLDYNFTFADRTSIRPKDFMVSDIIPIKAEDINKPHHVQFKRLSSVIRMKINDDTDGKILKDEEIDNVMISGLFGVVGYNYIDKTFETYYFDDEPYTVYVDGLKYKPGDGSFVFSCMPRTFKAGEEIWIEVTTKSHGEFSKIITVGEDGIVFESGKVTNLTLNLRDSDMTKRGAINPKPDEALDPTIEGNVITMKPGNPGRMTSDMIIKAIGTGKSYKVVGDINAFDINSIRKISTGDAGTNLKGIKADLSKANIKADEKAVYIYFMNDTYSPIKITEDNTAYNYMFLTNSIVSELILPNSLTTIKTDAIYCDMGTSVTVGKNIQNMEIGCINLNTKSGTGNATLKILAEPSNSLNFNNSFYENNRLCDLILNNKWNGHKMDKYQINGKNWVIPYYQWASISFCDDNGNPIL